MIMKINIFQKILLDHEDFISSMFYFIMALSNYYKILGNEKFCGKIFTSHEIFV